VKEKLSPLDACGTTAGFGAGGLVAVGEKKSPPLNGGGEVTWVGAGAAFTGTALGKLRPVKEDDCDAGDATADGKPNAEAGDCTGGDLAVEGPLEKLIPPNASAKPPNASCLGAAGDDIPPKEACRSCIGCGAC